MAYFSWVADPKAWLGLATLTFLQIVLGADNIVLLTILSGRLRGRRQALALRWGLLAAMASRLLLLCSLLWLAQVFTAPLLRVSGLRLSGKDLILIGGGLFLIAKATTEIHHRIEGDEHRYSFRPAPTLPAVLAQIFVLDIVFSLDSVITALGMIKILAIQILAVVIAAGLMMMGIESIARFINRHATVKILALSFLVLIGVNLVAEGLGFDIPRGYTYFAMAWSVLVEMLNLRAIKLQKAAIAAQPSPERQPRPNEHESTPPRKDPTAQAPQKRRSGASGKGSSSRRLRR